MHLQAVERGTGEAPPELHTPEPPAHLAYLMAWWDELACARPDGMVEPAPIAWAEMTAWATAMGYAVQPWQFAVLRQLDTLWRAAWRAGRPKKATPKVSD